MNKDIIIFIRNKGARVLDCKLPYKIIKNKKIFYIDKMIRSNTYGIVNNNLNRASIPKEIHEILDYLNKK